MNHRFKIILSILPWLLIVTSTQAFKVDRELSASADIQRHSNVFEDIQIQAGTPPGLQTRPRASALPSRAPVQANGAQQSRPSGLFLMFNLPMLDQVSGKIQGSHSFYFDIFATGMSIGASNTNHGAFTDWVECDVCRSIFDIEYEKFFDCGKQLFFGWC